MITREIIRERMSARRPRIDDGGAALGGDADSGNAVAPYRAAVALVLRAGASGPEVLFIERAQHDDDPWSGHLSFPGGRLEPGDATLRDAAERETFEELALEFRDAEFLGQLDDVRGLMIGILISAFVYFLLEDRPLLPSDEVACAFWVPLATLTDPTGRVTEVFRAGDREVTLPAIDVLGAGRPRLWGLTLRFVEDFVQIIDATSKPDGATLGKDVE